MPEALEGGLIGHAVDGLHIEEVTAIIQRVRERWKEGEAAEKPDKDADDSDDLERGMVGPVHFRNVCMATQVLMDSKTIVKIMKNSMLKMKM